MPKRHRATTYGSREDRAVTIMARAGAAKKPSRSLRKRAAVAEQAAGLAIGRVGRKKKPCA